MKAAMLGDPGEIRVVERKIPEPKPGWVRLGTTASGICGSDLHLFHGSPPARGLQPGHEVAGIVDALGDGVQLETGLKVALEPIFGCGGCGHCQTGYYNRCLEFQLFGFQAPGGLAEYLTVPANRLHPLPAELDDHVAALAEPAAVCVRGVRLGGVSMGDQVAVLGAGSIGLLTLVAARQAGAARVLVTARYPHQAELARHLGATEVFSSGAALADAVGPDAVDVVVETVGGQADTLAEAVGVARPGATIVVLGVFDGAPAFMDLDFLQKELTMVGSLCYARNAHVGDFAMAVDLVAAERDKLGALITHRFKLDQVAEAYATADDKTSGAIKVQLTP
jgi:threonine dehydrogenase-like Zn-dependent dehydrogenase